LPFIAIPSARLEAEETMPPFFIFIPNLFFSPNFCFIVLRIRSTDVAPGATFTEVNSASDLPLFRLATALRPGFLAGASFLTGASVLGASFLAGASVLEA
jgi:hypothetical protein